MCSRVFALSFARIELNDNTAENEAEIFLYYSKKTKKIKKIFAYPEYKRENFIWYKLRKKIMSRIELRTNGLLFKKLISHACIIKSICIVSMFIRSRKEYYSKQKEL